MYLPLPVKLNKFFTIKFIKYNLLKVKFPNLFYQVQQGSICIV
jgi:hypothetical protein